MGEQVLGNLSVSELMSVSELVLEEVPGQVSVLELVLEEVSRWVLVSELVLEEVLGAGIGGGMVCN